MSREVADLLRRAKALIDKPEKWRQGPSCLGQRRCATEAIVDAGNPDKVGIGGAHIYLCEAAGIASVIHWNDAPGRTHAEVMAAFDRAIEMAEAHDVRM